MKLWVKALLLVFYFVSIYIVFGMGKSSGISEYSRKPVQIMKWSNQTGKLDLFPEYCYGDQLYGKPCSSTITESYLTLINGLDNACKNQANFQSSRTTLCSTIPGLVNGSFTTFCN